MKTKKVFSFEISDNEKIVYVTALDQITLQACVDLIEDSIKKLKDKLGYRALIDLRKMKYDPTFDSMSQYLAAYVLTKKEYFTNKVGL